MTARLRGDVVRAAVGVLLAAALGLGTTVGGLEAQDAGADDVHIRQVSVSERPADVGDPGHREGAHPAVGRAGRASFARLRQFGQGNRADVLQHGAGHAAEVLQEGVGHVALAVMSGAGSFLELHQSGARNVSRIEISEDGGSLDVRQIGRDLTYIDRFTFTGEGLHGSISQEGSDLEIVQEGRWPTGFRIRQRGHGFGIRVSHVRGGIVTSPIGR